MYPAWGEGDGTPLQYSCLENPMDGEAWWAAVHELDTTERLPFHFSLSCIGEGNGNPLQWSCLENPRDGGAWWTAVYGIAQSRTQLKRLSSSSSRQEELCYKGIWQSNGDSETSMFGLTTKSFNHSQPHGSCDMFVNCTWVNMVVTHGILTRQLQSL